MPRRSRSRCDWTALAAGPISRRRGPFAARSRRAVRQAARRSRSPSGAAGRARRRGRGLRRPGLGGAAARPRDEAAASWPRGRAIDHARDRPLRAAHGLNRALLLTDAGEPEAALDVLRAAREQLGDWPLLAPLDSMMVAQEGLLRAAVGEREAARALLERAESEAATSGAVANAIARLRLLDGDAAGARAVLGPHLGRRRRRLERRRPASVRAESWLLDALALDALGRPRRRGARARARARHRRARRLRRLI